MAKYKYSLEDLIRDYDEAMAWSPPQPSFPSEGRINPMDVQAKLLQAAKAQREPMNNQVMNNAIR